MILLLLLHVVTAAVINHRSTNFNSDELIIITCPFSEQPVVVHVGGDRYEIPPKTVEFVVIATSFDMVSAPDAVDVERVVVQVKEAQLLTRGTADDCEIKCLLGWQDITSKLILSNNRMVPYRECLKFADLDAGHVHLYSRGIITKMTLNQNFPIFKVTHRIVESDGFVNIYRPHMAPCIPPADLSVYADVYVLSELSEGDPSVFVGVLNIPHDRPAVVESLTSPDQSYIFNISIVTTSGSILHVSSSGVTYRKDTNPADRFGHSPYDLGIIPSPPPPLITTMVPLLTMIELEHDQVMPLSPDDHPAFVHAWVPIESNAGAFMQVIVQVNGEFFVVPKPSHTFTAWFGVDYHVWFYLQDYRGEFYESSLAVLRAPQPAYAEIMHPVIRGVDGRIEFNLTTNLHDFQIDYAELEVNPPVWKVSLPKWAPDITLRYGDSTITLKMPANEQLKQMEAAAENNPISGPSPQIAKPSSDLKIELQAVIGEDWRGELAHEELCGGMVTFSVPLKVGFAVHHVVSPYKTTVMSDSFTIAAPFYTGEARVILVPVAGSLQRREVEAVIKFPSKTAYGASGGRVGIDFPPPRVITVLPYRSSTQKGRIVMSGGVNITSVRGNAVDPMILTQGVYLATATQVFDGIRCVHRQLVTVPPLLPAKLVEVKIGAPPVCRRSLSPASKQSMFQISIPNRDEDGILWDEETGHTMKITSGIVEIHAPGRFQVYYPASGAYSRPFELREVAWDAADFDFNRYAPRTEVACGRPLDDPLLIYPPHLADKMQVDVIECTPYCPHGGCDANCAGLQIMREDPGRVVFAGLPFVSSLRVQITIDDSCHFVVKTHLLPSPDKLPTSISGIEYRPTCDIAWGDDTWHALYVDPLTGENRRVPTDIFGVSLSSSMEDDVIKVEVDAWSDDGCAISGIFKVPMDDLFTPPVLEVKDVKPVFCPGTTDASIVLAAYFARADTAGIEYESVLIPLQLPGMSTFAHRGFGAYRFTLKTAYEKWHLNCENEVIVKIKEKKHFNVESHIRGVIDNADTFESSLTLQAHAGDSEAEKPEIERFTADMLAPADRLYIDDRGFGTDTLHHIPNGYVIDILVPYPDSYAHIRDDFCKEKLHLTLGMRATPISRELVDIKNLYPVITAPPSPPEDACQPAMTLNQRRMTTIHHAFISTTTPFTHSLHPQVRRFNTNPHFTLVVTSANCVITTIPSCPLCTNGVITSQHGGPGTLYVWDDLGSPLMTNVRTGVGVGNYFMSVIEIGQNVVESGAPRCIVTVSETHTPYVESVSTSFPVGCLGSTWVKLTILVGNNPSDGSVTGGAWLTGLDPPIVACDDPRLRATNPLNQVALQVLPSMQYSTAICDGGGIVPGEFIHTPGPDNPLLVFEQVSAGGVCYSPAGVVPIAPPILRSNNGPILGNLAVSPFYVTFSVVIINSSSFEIIFPDYDTIGPFSVTISDSRECPAVVTLNPEVGVCSDNVTAMAEDGELDPAPYDCIITFNETVPEAVIEIEYCVAHNQPVLGSNAPIISLPVVLAATPQMTMEFLQYNSSIYMPGSFAYMQNVNIFGANSSLVLAATVVSASNGVLNTTIVLPGNVNVGGVVPNQQVTFQYGALDGSFLMAGPGSSSLQIFIAHIIVGPLSVNVSRNNVNLQLIQSSIAVLGLYLPGLQYQLGLSNDGSSPIQLLQVFIAGINATSNSTMQVVCHYILTYPQIVLTAQAGNNGTLVVDSDQCIDFGTVVTPSQSRSVNKYPIYTQQTELPQSLFLFAFVIGFVVLMGVMIIFIRGIER
jgi:hypothetical protein